MKKGLAELVSIDASIKSEDNSSDNASHDKVKAAFDEMKTVVGGVKEAADELASDVFGGIVKVAESNSGKIPDVNDLVRQVLADELKDLEVNGGDKIRINELRDILSR